MNGLQLLLVVLSAVFVVLLPLPATRRIAKGYARVVLLGVAGTVIMLPFVWLACAAFKDKSVLNEYTFLPPPTQISSPTVNLDNFRNLLEDKQTIQGPVSFWRYVVNSLFLASAGTFISLVFSSMGGYALAKFRFPGRTAVVTVMLASLAVPAVALLAPTFEVIWKLGWMDTYKALVVPSAVTVFGIFLFRQAILHVPDDLIEAGRIDGCGEFRIYLTLVMPLVRPMTAAYCLITFLAAWNAFLNPNIFLQSQDKLTLPVVLAQYIVVYQQQYGVFLAGTLLAIVPPAILFLMLQREFISGLTSGAVKQ
jgi:ABC-type glycerol-3-phosphate transport system permease component